MGVPSPHVRNHFSLRCGPRIEKEGSNQVQPRCGTAMISLRIASQMRDSAFEMGVSPPHVRSHFSLRSDSRIEKKGFLQVLLEYGSISLIEKLILTRKWHFEKVLSVRMFEVKFEIRNCFELRKWAISSCTSCFSKFERPLSYAKWVLKICIT
mgnify:CR=1 FL=1